MESLTDNASIARYIEETHPVPPLLGTTALEKALVAEWNARVEYEGFLAAAEAVRNRSKGFAGHALTGAKGYEQIPALAERGMARSKDFLTMLDARLGESRYVAGDFYSVVDISAVIAVDFIGWLKITIAPEQKNLQRWFDEISARPAYKA